MTHTQTHTDTHTHTHTEREREREREREPRIHERHNLYSSFSNLINRMHYINKIP